MKMKIKILMLLLVLVLSLFVTGLALAEDGIELPRWVLGGGATDTVAGEITLRATLGQPVVGVVSVGNVSLGQGFWHGGEISDVGNAIYLPLLAK